jgi:hypothetical protein
VHVALNAQQFVGNASARFEYFLMPAVSSISPSSGPRVGGTLVNVSGVDFAFGSHYQCAFGADVVPASFAAAPGGEDVISCVSPASAAGLEVALEVSLNAQEFSSEAVHFRFHGIPVASSYSPSSGPTSGGTLVRVSGSALGGGSDYRCRFDSCGPCVAAWSCGPCVVNASFVAAQGGGAEGVVLCVSPAVSGWRPVEAAAVALAVSLNSQEYTEGNVSALAYQFYVPPELASVSPSLGPTAGATRLRVAGTGLDGADSHLKCRFNESEVPATYDANTSAMLCSAAVSARAGASDLQVSLNGQQFGPSWLTFGYHRPTAVTSVGPGAGSTEGGTEVVVAGESLASGAGFGPDYRCRFGETIVPASLFLTSLTCTSPSAEAGTGALEVSLNAQDYTQDAASFSVAPPIVISALVPAFGPAAGGTRMLVHASHLDTGGWSDRRCRFGNASGSVLTLPGTYQPVEGALLCVSPPAVAAPLRISTNAQQASFPPHHSALLPCPSLMSPARAVRWDEREFLHPADPRRSEPELWAIVWRDERDGDRLQLPGDGVRHVSVRCRRVAGNARRKRHAALPHTGAARDGRDTRAPPRVHRGTRGRCSARCDRRPAPPHSWLHAPARSLRRQRHGL